MTDVEQRKLVAYIIEAIEIHKETRGKDLSRLKAITLTFSVSYDGVESNKILWDNETHVETVVLITRVNE